jgi:energy-coupling factor transport system ATP-binding protein
MSAMLSFRGVTYHYPGADTPALRDVGFDIQPGEVCLLAGLSGQGKSTLLRAACGLVPHFQGGRFAGTVKLAGLDTRDHGPAQLGVFAGALFQDPETQLVTNSVRAELSLPLESRGRDALATARGVEEVALALGVDALLDRSVHELSGGEQQRVALAASLAGRPPVVLLDEPTSQLDPVAGDELISLLRRLNEEWEMTILLAEHRLERCLSIADRVIAMERGEIAHDGDPASFLRWAAKCAPALQTPGAKMFSLAGFQPAPVGVRDARAELRRRGLLSDGDGARGGVESANLEATGLEGAGPEGAGLDGAGLEAAGLEVAGRGDATAEWLGREGVERGERVAGAGGGGTGSFKAAATSGARRMTGMRRTRGTSPALALHGVWHELASGPAILRGVKLAVEPGESIALMGRNGAGKSTLLRHAAGLLEPTRGRIERAGRVALLLQNPGDYLLHERVRDEAPAPVLAGAGLAGLADRNPRDLSGGERQRLALAIVCGDGRPGEGARAAVLALDEPTRGMDREAKAALAADLTARARSGQAIVVATHDPEFAACCATRCVLIADGRVIADGPTHELLAGGWYFATETARILGAGAGALVPSEGAALLKARSVAAAGAALDGATLVPGELAGGVL